MTPTIPVSNKRNRAVKRSHGESLANEEALDRLQQVTNTKTNNSNNSIATAAQTLQQANLNQNYLLNRAQPITNPWFIPGYQSMFNYNYTAHGMLSGYASTN